jgi:hypothetical protein
MTAAIESAWNQPTVRGRQSSGAPPSGSAGGPDTECAVNDDRLRDPDHAPLAPDRPGLPAPAYRLAGTFLRAGGEPGAGGCAGVTGWRLSRGEIRGVDVAGLAYLALLDAIRGRLGGPLADLAATVAEELGAYQVPIDWGLVAHAGTVASPGRVKIVVAPAASKPGMRTALRDARCRAPPGSTGRQIRVVEAAVSVPEHGLVWSCRDRGGIAGEFWLMAARPSGVE